MEAGPLGRANGSCMEVARMAKRPLFAKKRGGVARKPRKRDRLFDAIAEVTGSHPEVSGSGIGRAATALRKINATVDDVLEMAAWYKAKYPGFHLQPTMIVKWWGQFIADRSSGVHHAQRTKCGGVAGSGQYGDIEFRRKDSRCPGAAPASASDGEIASVAEPDQLQQRSLLAR